MHPIDVLSDEHRMIGQVLAALEGQLENLDGGAFPRGFFDQALDFLSNFADAIHHAREERLLFPLMEQRGVPRTGGVLGVMLGEHQQGRVYLAGIRDHLDAAADGSVSSRAAIRDYGSAYVLLLRSHIRKEDQVLFRLAQMVLNTADTAALARDFALEGIAPRHRDFAVAAGALQPPSRPAVVSS